MESEDEPDSDPDYDGEQKPKANKKKKHFKENEYEELKGESYFEFNCELSNKDEKEEETLENVLNEELGSENEYLVRLEIENSENSDGYDFTEERLPPELPLVQSSTSGFPRTHKSIIECRDQLTMRKDNHAYFVTDK